MPCPGTLAPVHENDERRETLWEYHHLIQIRKEDLVLCLKCTCFKARISQLYKQSKLNMGVYTEGVTVAHVLCQDLFWCHKWLWKYHSLKISKTSGIWSLFANVVTNTHFQSCGHSYMCHLPENMPLKWVYYVSWLSCNALLVDLLLHLAPSCI